MAGTMVDGLQNTYTYQATPASLIPKRHYRSAHLPARRRFSPRTPLTLYTLQQNSPYAHCLPHYCATAHYGSGSDTYAHNMPASFTFAPLACTGLPTYKQRAAP